MDTIAYFLDKNTFDIVDVVELQKYTINLDEETNAKTTFTVLQKLHAQDKDIVVIKENNKIKYIGIIEAPSNEDGSIKYDITAKYITNIFDRKIILKNQSLIAEEGIEDFIYQTILDEFTNSTDNLLNKTFLDVEVLTHTKKNFSVNNDNGIYNFHTFINNCTQKYNIVYSFRIIGNRLKMTIQNIGSAEEKLIDCNVQDIIEYKEIFKTNVTAKVRVICKDQSEHEYFLLNNRTVTEEKNDENRAMGEIETIYEELQENAKEAAMNIFRSNSYSHLIQFKVYKSSTLYNVDDWQIGQKIKIKNRTNDIIDSYISATTEEGGSQFLQIKTGNIRITLLDKLKQEKNRGN